MRTDNILFKTALLANKAGFHLVNSCSIYYSSKGEKHGIKSNLNINEVIKKQSSIILAPKQNLLQKWLREVHNAHLIIYLDDDGYTVEWDVLDENGKWDSKKQGAKEGFKTYELALEEGLKELLKQIKSK